MNTQKYLNTYVHLHTSSDPSEALQLSLDLPEEDDEEENESVTEQLSASEAGVATGQIETSSVQARGRGPAYLVFCTRWLQV